MQVIPIQAVPSQTLNVQLPGANGQTLQACTINLYQNDQYGLFMDLYVNAVIFVGGVLCENAVALVRYPYLGFNGDLAFYDQNAGPQVPATDPVYTGLGTQYVLMWLSPTDLAGFSA